VARLQVGEEVAVKLLLGLHVALKLGLLIRQQTLVLVQFLGVEVLKLTNLAYIFLDLKLMSLVDLG
jgi:hypothetical protein